MRGNLSNTASDKLLRQDLQTQLNACLIRLEHDISQRLGQCTLQRLEHNGLDLLRSGKDLLLEFVNQVHLAFRFEEESYSLEFQWQAHDYRNADRPSYVRDGYIYLHLSERNILRRFLRQKTCYKAMLELLADHIVRYIEKVYYRIEQHWQEFQSHFMVLAEHSEDIIESYGPVEEAYNVSLDTGRIENPSMVESPENTASQIAQRHRRIKQLQTIARNFWQDNFAYALALLRLDLPNWENKAQRSRLDISDNQGAKEPTIVFKPCYITLLKELELRCNLVSQRQDLFERLRKILEQSFHDFPLETAHNSHSEVRYAEYLGEDIRPDEWLELHLWNATDIWLQQWANLNEQSLIGLSQQVRDFFSRVEKITRFQWFGNGVAMAVGGVSRLVSRSFAKAGKKQSLAAIFSGKELTEQQGNIAIAELLQQSVDSLNPLNQFGPNRGYELRLLLELLHRAELALHYQRKLSAKHYALLNRLPRLRRELLRFCQKPSYSQSGIQITAFYRTVSKRSETFLRVEKILKDFCSNYSLQKL